MLQNIDKFYHLVKECPCWEVNNDNIVSMTYRIFLKMSHLCNFNVNKQGIKEKSKVSFPLFTKIRNIKAPRKQLHFIAAAVL